MYGGRRENLTLRAVHRRVEVYKGQECRLCRLGIHRRVECDAALAQRLIEQRCKDEHEERRLECHHAIEQTQTDGDGNERNRECGNQLQCECGDKGEPQDGERCLGEAVAHVREMCALGVDAAKDLERHRRAYELAEPVRERLHLVPLTFARTARCLSDEEEQERCNRQCHEKEQRREWVCKRRDNEDQRDEHCARNHRWQHRVEEWGECIDALQRECQRTGGTASMQEHCLVEGCACGEAHAMGELCLDTALGEA